MDKGIEVVINLVIFCIGIKINNFVYCNVFESRLVSSGVLRVNEYFQVEGYSNVYVIGDCVDVRMFKMVYFVGFYVNIVVVNIVNFVKQWFFQVYKLGVLMFFLFMGRNDGVG